MSGVFKFPTIIVLLSISSFKLVKDGEALYSQQKQHQELTVVQIMNSLLPNSDLIEESRENH